MREIILNSKKPKEVIDITDLINKVIKEINVTDGIAHLFVVHTTAALTTADLDPGTDLDMIDAFETMVPKLHYQHPHDPAHVSDHILSALIGTSLVIPFRNRALILGEWQRVVLVEFSGPRKRKLIISF